MADHIKFDEAYQGLQALRRSIGAVKYLQGLTHREPIFYSGFAERTINALCLAVNALPEPPQAYWLVVEVLPLPLTPGEAREWLEGSSETLAECSYSMLQVAKGVRPAWEVHLREAAEHYILPRHRK